MPVVLAVPEPLSSMGPLDWCAHADALLDAGASQRKCDLARRVAKALRMRRPALVLVGRYLMGWTNDSPGKNREVELPVLWKRGEIDTLGLLGLHWTTLSDAVRRQWGPSELFVCSCPAEVKGLVDGFPEVAHAFFSRHARGVKLP